MSRATQKKKSKKVSGVDPFDAADFARAAALEDAKNEKYVGSQISVESDEDHVATYLFEAFLPGYVGWRWAVTVAKVDAKSSPTICDVVLLPGADALLAPNWIPYSERITAEDVGVGTIVPTAADDARLVPASAVLPSDEELDLHELFELGAGRLRVLSIKAVIKRQSVGLKATADQMRPSHNLLQRIVEVVVSTYRSRAHSDRPLASALTRFHLKMRVWSR